MLQRATIITNQWFGRIKIKIRFIFFLFFYFEMEKNTCPICSDKSTTFLRIGAKPPKSYTNNPCAPFCRKIRIQGNTCTLKCGSCNTITPQDCSEDEHDNILHTQYRVICNSLRCNPDKFCKTCLHSGVYSQSRPLCAQCERQAFKEFIEKHNK